MRIALPAERRHLRGAPGELRLRLLAALLRAQQRALGLEALHAQGLLEPAAALLEDVGLAAALLRLPREGLALCVEPLVLRLVVVATRTLDEAQLAQLGTHPLELGALLLGLAEQAHAHLVRRPDLGLRVLQLLRVAAHLRAQRQHLRGVLLHTGQHVLQVRGERPGPLDELGLPPAGELELLGQARALRAVVRVQLLALRLPHLQLGLQLPLRPLVALLLGLRLGQRPGALLAPPLALGVEEALQALGALVLLAQGLEEPRVVLPLAAAHHVRQHHDP
mmetsp:Transcript_95404/g.270054  ORF Transcript_95404/g.270054 Transcript_95404/m.270054 type:complete len:279 (+) Transcript_95404:913-1749(+)